MVQRRLPGPQDLDDIALLKARGFANTRIEKATQVDHRAVALALKDPGVIGQIQVYRERLRVTNLAAAAALAGKAWEKAEGALDNDDPKGYDAIMRGIAATEKIGASASGEDRKVEVSGTINTVSEPVKIQLQQLIALVRGEPTPRP